MNLGKEISNLLKKQQRVFVQGLGVFSRIHSSATFDQKQEVYFPPISYIEFDSKSTTGFDFVYYLQQLLSISYQDAVVQLDHEVANIHVKIKEDGKYHLASLGQLILFGNEYVFKPEDLSGFQFGAVDAQDTSKLQTVKDVLQGIPEPSYEYNESNAEALEQQPIAAEFVEENTYIEDDLPKKSKSALWFLLITVLALGGVFAIYYIYQNQIQQASRSVIDSTLLKPDTSTITTLPLDSTDTELQDSLTDTVLTQPIDSTKLAIKVKEKARYQIVIASAPTLEKAHKLAEKYHKMGFPNVKVIPSNVARNNKKVIWDSYVTKAEVDSALLYVKKHVVSDAWLDPIRK